MTIQHIGRKTAALSLTCLWLLLGGCGSQTSNEGQPAAQEEEALAAEEKTAAYVTAADDFSNLELDNPGLPVYDSYTLSQRRAKGLPTVLPSIRPYRETKTVYLTFDDGPDDKNTAAVLDILKQENVKATFYVLGKNVKAYPETTKRIFAEGHALGNHSYDHDYKRLYASADSYLKEMEEADDAIYELLGVRPLITRAPSGRMGNFTAAYENIIAANAYVEHDWNVSSADAAPNHPVAQDFIDNIQGQTVMDSAIILMHSSAGHEETVKALPEIIRILREKGYSFGVITPMTPQPW